MTRKRESGAARVTEGGAERYRATLDGLFARRRFGIRPGLEVVEAILAAHGNPQRRFPSVHITGSKGKGSTGAFTEAVLRAHGLRTGLFTSPHLASYRDRIQVDRDSIPPEAVIAGVERIDATARALEQAGTIDRAPTFFEVTTVLAFDWFAEREVDAAVVEVGLGGRLDATNVLASRVGVITTIELEHTELLGPDVGSIAREKAGIFHRGMSGIVGTLPPAAAAVVEAEADRAGVPLWHLGREFSYDHRALSETGQRVDLHLLGGPLEDVGVPLWGTFQAANLACAVAASARFLASLDRELSLPSLRRGLAQVHWPGRLERVAEHPDLYYDVAHTPDSARAVAESLGEMRPMSDPEDSAIVFGCLRGKDVARILDALSPLARTLVIVPVRSERSLSATDIRVEAAGRFPRIVVARSADEGVRMGRAATGPEGFTLVVGSDYLIGELLRPGGGAEPDLSDPGVGPTPAIRDGRG